MNRLAAHPWVFAYGSNMHLKDLTRWLRERGYPTTGIHRAAPARLRGWRLAWNYHSRVRAGAAANVQRDPSAHLLGVALQVDTATLEALDVKEGHPDLYYRGPAPHAAELLEEGRAVDAWLYVVRPQFLSPQPVAPRRHYLGLMIEAAQEHGLGSEYVLALRRVPTCD